VRIARCIGEYKRERGLGILDPGREEIILRRMVKRAEDLLPSQSVRRIYLEILSVSRAAFQPFRVVYWDPEEELCPRAILNRFGATGEFCPVSDSWDMFVEVEQSEGTVGVFSIGSAFRGAVTSFLDHFCRYDVKIQGTFYGLKDPVKGQSDHRNDIVRFLILGKAEVLPTGDDRTMISFRTGNLREALRSLGCREINMTWIESFSAGRCQEDDHLYIVELEGHIKDEALAASLEEIAMQTLNFKYLGSYPQTEEFLG